MESHRRADEKLPIVILGGSDRRPGAVPTGADSYHFIAGYKGAELKVADGPLIGELLERIRASGAFDCIYVAGPRKVYRDLVDCSIIDTDSNVGQNIRAAVKQVQKIHGRETGVAFITYDVLPTAEEIAELTARLTRGERSDASAGEELPRSPALALSLVTEKQDLGASVWKPKYRIRPEPGEDPIAFLPGHLAVAWPSKLRTGLFYRTLQLAYQERNKDYDHRRRTILLQLLRLLLWRDFLNLFRLYPPTLTYSVLRHGLRAFMRWRKGELDLRELRWAIGKVIVRRRHFRELELQAVRIAVTAHTSFAKDFDTEEEIEELRQKLKRGAP